MKVRIIRDIKNLFELEENYYKPVRVGTFYSDNYMMHGLTLKPKLLFSKDTDEKNLMHSKSYNKEIIINDKADKVIKKLFESLLSRYQIGLKQRWKVATLFLLCWFTALQMAWNKSEWWWIIYRFYWLHLKRKATINPTNKYDDNCFQYTLTFTKNHEETGKK